MQAIFISYRRQDAEGEAGRLFDDLVREFGDGSVFMDVSTIQAGRDFRKVIDDSVATCGVLLAIIGVNWVDAKNEAGERRLDDPADFVRLETASALRRDIPVIPVLVRGAKMPSASALPDDLKNLAYRNAVELTHARWNSDVQILIKTLRQLVGGTQPSPPQPRPDTGNGKGKLRRSVVLAASAAAVAVALGIFYFLPGKSTSVPDVSGKSLAGASATLGAAHLAVGATRTQIDPTKEPDTVISQSPAASASARRGSKVDLVLTPPLVEIPDVVGQSLHLAERAMRERQLVVGDVQRERRDGAVANSVLREFPPAGRSVKPGSKIDLVVAEAAGAGTEGQQPRPPKQTSGQAAQDLVMTLTAGCKPCSVRPGGKVAVYVIAKDPSGNGIAGARVSLASGGGDFGDGGGTRYGGDTDARGVYQTIWTAPQPAAPAYGLGVEVAKDGFRTTSTNVAVAVEGTGRSERPPSKYPNFGGTWEMFEVTLNGTSQKVSTRPLVIAQNGGEVTIGGRTLSIRGDGAVSYQTFSAGPNPGHRVETASQADLIDTLTWRLDGAILVFETIFDYRRAYGNHGPGRDLRIMKYRRVP
jgi:TIR domain/PASTA domain